MKIAIDLGYGHSKVVTRKNQIMFPSVIADAPGVNAVSVIGHMDDYFVSYADTTDKGVSTPRYAFVGSAGITNDGIRRWEGKERLDSEEIKLLVATATAAVLYEEKPNENEPIDLCVGLPMSYFTDTRTKMELFNILSDLNGIITLNKGKPLMIRYHSVKIYAQSAGAYYSVICDINGRIRNPIYMKRSIAVIDIGFRNQVF